MLRFIATARSLLCVVAMLTDPFGTNQITKRIIGCGIRVHDVVGPGVYENVYPECMGYELKQEGLRFESARAVPIVYKGVRLNSRYYIDLVVEDSVIVELKAIAALADIHRKQLLTYLKLTGLPWGSSSTSMSTRSPTAA